MTIALPENKFLAYSTNAINEILDHGWTSKRELKMNIRRWVPLGQIIPFIHHFLSRLHFLLQKSEKKCKVEIKEQCKDDLKFSLFSLKKMLQWSQLKHNFILMPNLSILVGLMPCRTWWLQQQMLCMVILPSARNEIPRVKQEPPQAPHSNHYSMGGHHHGKTLAWQLRPLHDLQQDVERLAHENKSRMAMAKTQSKQQFNLKWLITMTPTTSCTESRNTANGFTMQTTLSPMPSPMTMTGPTNN
jgi:hypothetical protein